MGLSQSNRRLLGGTKSSLSTTFTPCLMGGALTEEQIKERNRRQRERYANLTEEQRREHNRRCRERYANLTEEQRRRQRERRANMTAEQRKEKNRKLREWRANLTEEQRKERNRRRRERRAEQRKEAAAEEASTALASLVAEYNKQRRLQEQQEPTGSESTDSDSD